MSPQETYKLKLEQLTATFQAKVKAAQAENRPQDIQLALAEYQTETAALAEWFNTALNAPKPAVASEENYDIYAQDLCNLDLNFVGYRGDRNQLRKLFADAHLAEGTAAIVKTLRPDLTHRRLMLRSLRLTPQMAPQLFKVYHRIAKQLDIKAEVQFYSLASSDFQASCYPTVDGAIPIGISSALLEKFNDEELAFVVGHEIGHAIFNHFRMPARILIQDFSHQLTPVQTVRLQAWERAAELSADRIGLLCTDSFQNAASAFFKLSSGISSDRFAFRANDYLAQYENMERCLREAKQGELEDLYTTHPLSPIRLKALELFSRSDLYAKLTGRSGFEISAASMETEIAGFMRLMDPTYLDETSDVASASRDFIFYGGFLVGCADGELQDVELQALTGFLGADEVENRLRELKGLSTQEVGEALEKRAVVLNSQLSLVSKLALLRDLVSVMTADQKVTVGEMEMMSKICDVLQVSPRFIEDVLAEGRAPAAA